eukprot:scaffold71625_cov54-Phaeocystis_antarctica.AAC.3
MTGMAAPVVHHGTRYARHARSWHAVRIRRSCGTARHAIRPRRVPGLVRGTYGTAAAQRPAPPRGTRVTPAAATRRVPRRSLGPGSGLGLGLGLVRHRVRVRVRVRLARACRHRWFVRQPSQRVAIADHDPPQLDRGQLLQVQAGHGADERQGREPAAEACCAHRPGQPRRTRPLAPNYWRVKKDLKRAELEPLLVPTNSARHSETYPIRTRAACHADARGGSADGGAI